MRDGLFRDRWADRGDRGFRPFAVALLLLAPLVDMPIEERRIFYRKTVTVRRSALLAEVTNCPMPRAVVKLIERCDWRLFEASDWDRLITASRDQKLMEALSGLEGISAGLVRQLELVPDAFRVAPILRVLNQLGEVPAERWRHLARQIACATFAQLGTVLCLPSAVRSVGDFWDLYFRLAPRRRWTGNEEDISFELAEGLRSKVQILEPLCSARQLETMGRRFKDNSLRHMAWGAFWGELILFRHKRSPPVVAVLMKFRPNSWEPVWIEAPASSEVDPKLAKQIREELVQLADHLPVPAPTKPRLSSLRGRVIADLCRDARGLFSADEIEAVFQALTAIHGLCFGPRQRAFVIAEVENNRSVKFTTTPNGQDYCCQISYRRTRRERADFLTVDVVDVIDRAGFVWAFAGNFKQWFAISESDDLRRLAELGLALLARVYLHRPGAPVKLKTYVPDDLSSCYRTA